ncbi:S41 family peptidase [Rossellomorea aquimaris]|uniref:S41 family peptidase n=1 Tax=Rossellomorea aquimaris TaxID=189382 RepID=UPI000AAB22A3|nr:S41 family peptidase [Rossellomorea aquimaris]
MTRITHICFIVFLFVFSFSIPSNAQSNDILEEVRENIKNHYYKTVDDHILNLSSLEEILSNLDPYSTYFSPETNSSFQNSINNKYIGIGIALSHEHNKYIIEHVYPSSPADLVGIEEGDQILQVDGVSIVELSTEEVLHRLKGEVNTEISLTIKRLDQTKRFLCMREYITLPTVTFKKLGENVGYLSISSFSQSMVSELDYWINQFPDTDDWIIDLRNNPGGYVSAALKMIGMFPNVEDAIIVENQYGRDMIHPLYQNSKFKNRVALLTNSFSASASEIVTAAVKNTKNVQIYGGQTYGKGLMQSIIPLSNSGSLKLSTYQFYTPTGEEIHKKGIAPNIQTLLPLKDAHHDLIHARYPSYKRIASLTSISTTSLFSVSFSQLVDVTSFQHSMVTLETLGGKNVSVILYGNNQNLFVQPMEELIPNERYVLILHPGWHSSDGKASTVGTILDIQVSNNETINPVDIE